MARIDLPTPKGPDDLGIIDGLGYSLWLPERDTVAGLVVLHGAGSCKENHHDMARAGRAAGFATVAFDQRGHGASKGDLDDRVIDDVRTVATLLPAGLPLALRGSSMGGAVAILAGAALQAAAVVAVCPAPTSLLLRGLRDGRFDFRADRARLDPFLAEHPLDDAVRSMPGRLLLQHAGGDERVPVQSSIDLAALAGDRAKLIVVPGGHHRSVQHDPELQGIALRFIAQAARAARP